MTDITRFSEDQNPRPEINHPWVKSKVVRVAGFLIVVFVVLAAGLGVGQLFDDGDGGRGSFGTADGKGGTHPHHNTPAPPMKEDEVVPEGDILSGAAATDQGYTLKPENTELMACTRQIFRFRILGPDGGAVRTYSATDDERMRLGIVRQDFSGYQQVLPELDAASGVWSAPISLVSGGRWRVLVDFVAKTPENREIPLKLGIDVNSDRIYALRTLPPPAKTSTVGGVTIAMSGEPKAGEMTRLEFTSTRAGAPVPLQPYMGDYAHLVVLRQGDYGYLHGAPEGRRADNTAAFSLNLPEVSTYVAYLHFKANGQVNTAVFTLRVE